MNYNNIKQSIITNVQDNIYLYSLMSQVIILYFDPVLFLCMIGIYSLNNVINTDYDVSFRLSSKEKEIPIITNNNISIDNDTLSIIYDSDQDEKAKIE